MSSRSVVRVFSQLALASPLPSGQLEWLKLPPPPVGGAVGVGCGATVVGGVDEDGELPPQDAIRRANIPAVTTAAAEDRL
jgi:hypothetical protein